MQRREKRNESIIISCFGQSGYKLEKLIPIKIVKVVM